MRVKVKETGEVLNLAEYARVQTDHVDGWGNTIEYRFDEVEFMPEEPENSEQKQIDWEQRRYEIAKACMTGLIPLNETIHDTAQLAIEYADELIKQLKGE